MFYFPEGSNFAKIWNIPFHLWTPFTLKSKLFISHFSLNYAFQNIHFSLHIFISFLYFFHLKCASCEQHIAWFCCSCFLTILIILFGLFDLIILNEIIDIFGLYLSFYLSYIYLTYVIVYNIFLYFSGFFS